MANAKRTGPLASSSEPKGLISRNRPCYLEARMTDVLETTEHEQRAEEKRFDAIWWGGTLVWLGIALGGDFLEILPRIDGEWWPWIFVGIGPWSLILNSYRVASVSAPNPSTWDWVWTVIFLAVAAGAFVDVDGAVFGALALVLVGVVILFRTLGGRD